MGVHSDSAASGSDPGGLEGALVCSLGVSGLLFGAPGCLQASKMTSRARFLVTDDKKALFPVTDESLPRPPVGPVFLVHWNPFQRQYFSAR